MGTSAADANTSQCVWSGMITGRLCDTSHCERCRGAEQLYYSMT